MVLSMYRMEQEEEYNIQVNEDKATTLFKDTEK
jgi:hypothetical protein